MQLASLLGHTEEVLGIIQDSDRPADSLIDQFFRSRKYLGSHDRKFIAETAYGTLRHLRRSDALLRVASKATGVEIPDEDRLVLLIAAFHQRERRQPELTPAVLSSCVTAASLKESIPQFLSVLATSALPRLNDEAERIGIQHSFADWMVRRVMDEYGPEMAERIFASLNEPAPLSLRVNTLRATPESCQQALSAQGIETTKAKFSPLGLIVPKRINIFSVPAFKDGQFEVQDEGSQLLPLLIDPKPTAKLLDACAGAGGKTLEFAALMKNRGEIHATDVNKFRLDKLKLRARRAGASNIRIREIGGLEDLEASHAGYFDIVFVDAPCSGLGTIRRNPGMKWKVQPQTVDEVSLKQAQILKASATLVKPGGRLVYATCTLLRQENESVVEAFLAAHPHFAPADLSAGAARLGLPEAVSNGWFKILPHTHGTDGFFCAVLNHREANGPNVPA